LDRFRLRTKYEKNLELRNLVFDKLLLGIAIVGLGVYLNYKLEGYRSGLEFDRIQQEAIFKEKFRVVSEIQWVQFDLNNELSSMIIDSDLSLMDSVKSHDKLYYEYLSRMSSTMSRYRHLLSERYYDQLDLIRLHYADFVDLAPNQWGKYFDYMKFLRRVALNLHKSELQVTPFDSSVAFYAFCPNAKYRADSAGVYLAANLEWWKASKARLGDLE
jgi:hypothetical protein